MASANTSVKDSFLSQLESVRVELKEKVSRAHQVLQGRETALLSELQQLEENYKGEKVNEQIDPLRIIKEQNITALKDNENKEIHKRNRAVLDSTRDMRRVELEWDLEGILGKIGSIRVSGLPDFKGEIYPVILHNKSIMDTSSTPADLFLLSVAIDPYINNIYYYDCRSSQVNFIYTFTDEMKMPRVIFINLNKVYVTQDIANSLSGYFLGRRYIKSVGREDEKQLEVFYVCEEKPKVLSIVDNHENLHPSQNRPQQAVNSEDKPIRGLKNLGNTCFMNSVLQCLSHTLPLRQFYVSDKYMHYLNNRGDLSYAFKRVMANMWGTTLGYVAPYELKRQVGIVAPRFTGYSQQDAHEFMRFLLNKLHEEINRAGVEGRKSPADNETLEEACARYLTWEDSRISELFGGMLRSDVYCSVCKNQSTVYIPFMDIALPIPRRKQWSYCLQCLFYDPAVHLTKCLKMLITKETLDEEERPYCNKCMKLTKSTKQLSMNILPRFLVIQLKRFSYYSKPTKLSTPVKFDETWKVPDSAKKNSHLLSIWDCLSFRWYTRRSLHCLLQVQRDLEVF